MHDDSAVGLPVAELRAAFRSRSLSPVEVAESALSRIEEIDHLLHAFVHVDKDETLRQARDAEKRYAAGDDAPLLGIPVSVKDAFDVAGWPTTLGSLHHVGNVASADSGVPRRLREAGAVFVGKTNTAEFGQSATTDNLLGPDTANPWDAARTPGGSSGGAAASVAAGMATVAVGSDGGGSVRIPASFTGLTGMKPTYGLCRDEGGFRGMTKFVCPGPLANNASDARTMLEVLSGRGLGTVLERSLTVAYCPHPENRPVDPAVTVAVADAAKALESLGHRVVERRIPVDGWHAVFGPLVLEDERRERGHLIAEPEKITEYEYASLRGPARLSQADVDWATAAWTLYRQRISDFFLEVDAILTPTVAVPSFELGRRPRTIDGKDVDPLWGPFPFTAAFNVAGTPAVTVPCGLADGMPVGAQLVTPAHTDDLLLALAAQLEGALAFDRAPLRGRLAEYATVSGSR